MEMSDIDLQTLDFRRMLRFRSSNVRFLTDVSDLTKFFLSSAGSAIFRVSRLRHIVTRVDKMLITDYFIVL